MLGFIMSMLITWYRRIGGAVHFYGLINPLGVVTGYETMPVPATSQRQLIYVKYVLLLSFNFLRCFRTDVPWKIMYAFRNFPLYISSLS